ncbi:MAG: Crp/Fnr family transcriptional regulator [Hyphomicrobiales bacterium]|nr:Crp/Fnr family transcriptional regulator [Hyphomicrobiales bacterium]
MPASSNRLLSSLSKSDFDLLAPHLVSTRFNIRRSLERPNRRIEAVFFPESGFASVVAIQSSKRQVEVGLIGREGMTGLSIVLGDHRTPHSTFVQAGGTALCMPAAELRNTMHASRSLRDLLLKYVQAFAMQTAHTAVCNAQSNVNQRLARWLLMAHDRIDSDLLPLTHDFLALMLGVRRPGVTEAMNALKTLGLIDSTRGQIRIRDRKGLERSAAESYGVPEAEYRRLLG